MMPFPVQPAATSTVSAASVPGAPVAVPAGSVYGPVLGSVATRGWPAVSANGPNGSPAAAPLTEGVELPVTSIGKLVTVPDALTAPICVNASTRFTGTVREMLASVSVIGSPGLTEAGAVALKVPVSVASVFRPTGAGSSMQSSDTGTDSACVPVGVACDGAGAATSTTAASRPTGAAAQPTTLQIRLDIRPLPLASAVVQSTDLVRSLP